MPKLQVIVGSTRPTRAADRVVPWVVERAQAHGGFEVELLDLRDWPLPFFQEHLGTIGDVSDPTYSDPIVLDWNRKIAEADAYLIVTAEYNHSVPGQLKNAIDNVFISFGFRNKPIGFVGYSLIPFVANAFNESGKPVNPATEIALGITLDDLAWFSNALGRARAAGELAPGTFRARAAAAAASED